MKKTLICFMLLFMLTGCGNIKDSNVLVTEKNGEETSKIEQESILDTKDITTPELTTSVPAETLGIIAPELTTSVPTETEPIITTTETGVSNKSNYANRAGVVVTKEQALTRISTISFNNVVEENLYPFFSSIFVLSYD